MEKIKNWNDIEEGGKYEEFKKLVAGVYPIKILDVTDYSDDLYLEIKFDIAKGDFVGYYTEIHQQFGGDYRGVIRRYYTEKALPFFKGSITAIERMNNGYAFDWNEKTLIGKYVLLVYREEEWLKEDGTIGISIKPYRFASKDEGEIKIPSIKKLTTAPGKATPKKEPIVSDEDMPF